MKTVVFDFDGTLADTFDVAVDAYNKVAPIFRISGIAPFERKVVRDLSLDEFARKYNVAGYKFLPLVIVLRILFSREKKKRKVALFPGAVESVRELKNYGFRCGILTTNSKKFVLSVLREEGVSGCFSFIETNPFLKKKHKTLTRLKYLYGEVVYVCDEGRDVIAAKKAGVVSVAVTWGFNSEKNIARFQPDYLVDSFAGLVNVLKGL
ncbi:HAD family hydrolase [Desulfurobacterium sp.]